MIAYDFVGNEISVGDEVITLLKNYREFTHATVKSIADKMLVVEYDKNSSKTYRVLHNAVIVKNNIIKKID